MIRLTRINGSEVVVNALLIQQIEALPDTIITLTTGARLMVQETPEAVVDCAVDYLRQLHSNTQNSTDEGPGGGGATAIGQWGRVVR